MVTWAVVGQWGSRGLDDAATALRHTRDELSAHVTDLKRDGRVARWTGAAADAAAASHTRLVDRGEEIVCDLSTAIRAIDDAGARMRRIEAAIRDIDHQAHTGHFTITDDGTVLDLAPPTAPHPDPIAAQDHHDRRPSTTPHSRRESPQSSDTPTNSTPTSRTPSNRSPKADSTPPTPAGLPTVCP